MPLGDTVHLSNLEGHLSPAASTLQSPYKFLEYIQQGDLYIL